MNIIEIAGNRYEVRRVGNSRQIKVNGGWMDSAAFIETLIDRNEYDQVGELFKLGHRTISDTLTSAPKSIS